MFSARRLTPDLVKALVIYTRAEDGNACVSAGILQFFMLLVESDGLRFPYKIHLMHQQEYGSVRAELFKPIQAIAVILEVLVHPACLYIEDIYHNPDMLEDCGLLSGQVRIHEGILAAAIPQIENEVPKEAYVVLLDINRCAQAGR